MQKINLILETIEKNSQRPIENKGLLKKYLKQSIDGGEIITFYNWECPPRILSVDKNGEIFVNYCVDTDKIFKGKKIDKYTEIPRAIKEKDSENKMLSVLLSLGLKIRFIKVIADTNAYYLTPNSLKIIGKKKIQSALFDFKSKIKEVSEKNYIINPRIYFFSKLMLKYKKEYEKYFYEALKIFNLGTDKLVSRKIWKLEMQHLENHIGLQKMGEREKEKFAQRVIASYAAEGMVFDLLSKQRNLSNCVWLNVGEATTEVIKITNCLKVRKNLEKLPMIFPR